jgi:hypothetical protein
VRAKLFGHVGGELLDACLANAVASEDGRNLRVVAMIAACRDADPTERFDLGCGLVE